VLYLGRLHPVKGLDRLIEAWAHLERHFPEWALELVGPDDGGYAMELLRLARRLNVERLLIKPSLWGREKEICMAAADLYVLPTRTENFALTVAESLMMQTPVIATKGAPWPGLEVERCGWWIEQGVEPLACAMKEAMHLGDTERRTMGQRGRAWMLRDYSWEVVARRLINIYSNLGDKASRMTASSEQPTNDCTWTRPT
jgi:glycosyltransferase involved in cell wall biosynthesis